MRSSRRIIGWLLFVSVLAMGALFGCRAFEPETVIVNHAPETYITGAPQEGFGGQFHFHIFWTGTDRDGRVERYVWALTDGTIQDPLTDEDEEDTRFNPAEFSGTLDIGHWTTRTDTIFDFQIGQGSITSTDKTFHIVAVDDRGDFDRTPARLYFLSNALDTPYIEFFRSSDQTPENRFADFDTIGYALPFEFTWTGDTPNRASYTDALLAATDTLPPLDGLYGFKYRLPLDVACDDVSQDCWNPSRLNAVSNRVESYFSETNHLEFTSDNSGIDVFHRRLTPNVHVLLVNTIDVAGVEIPVIDQPLNFVINYDPETRILQSEFDPFYDEDDVFAPGSPRIYPYYIHTSPAGERTATVFSEDELLPQRSVAMFKAIGWDDHRDVRKVDLPDEEASDFEVMFQGKFNAQGNYRGGEFSIFKFQTQYTELTHSAWDDYQNLELGASDTLSFIVGPFDYVVSMRTADEHLRRDGTPDEFAFFANHPPAMQCVEVVSYGEESDYYTETCEAGIDTFYCSLLTELPDHPNWTQLRRTNLTAINIWYNPYTNGIWHERPVNTEGLDSISGYFFEYDLLLYAEDYEEERLFQARTTPFEPTFGDPADRAFSWRYEVVSALDSLSNALQEGGGFDDLTQISYSFYEENGDYDLNYDDNGVWRLGVEVFVPEFALNVGVESYAGYLEYLHPGYDEVTIQNSVDLSTLQLGPSRCTVSVRDATDGRYRSDRCAYPYYYMVRAPEDHGESCSVQYPGMAGNPALDNYCAESEPFVKRYVIVMVDNSGNVYPPLE